MAEGQSGERDSVARIRDGASNILLSTEVMCGSETSTCMELLRPRPTAEHAVLGITYTRSADDWLVDFQQHFDADLAMLDLVKVNEMTRSTTTATAPAPRLGTKRAVAIESPQDLTGLSIHISQFIEQVETAWDDHDIEPIVCYDSVTALLQFVEPERAFRFLHVTTSRLRSAGATAHFHVHPSALDEQLVQKVAQLFDGRIHVGDDGCEDVAMR